MVEILAPVGNREMLVSAISAGCDSVYFGVDSLNMRANAKSFLVSELKDVMSYCHEHKVRGYLTVNTVIFAGEEEKIRNILKTAKSAGVDAIICWDHAVINIASELGLEIHLSTQASVANFEAVKFYSKLGVSRIVLARELSLKQIKEIHEQIVASGINVELETFIHGAMCVAVSGRCFMSQFLFNRSANRGDCLQPCRRAYKVTDKETGGELELQNNYVMSAKDLCSLPFIDKLVPAGISVFKIEGRSRSPEYVKTVVSVYKDAIENGYRDEMIIELEKVYNRKFSSGFYLGVPTSDDFTDIYGSNATERKEYSGYVVNYFKNAKAAEIKIESYEFSIGDRILIIGQTTGVQEAKVTSIEIAKVNIATALKGSSVAISLDFIARKNDKVYVIKSNDCASF